MMVRDMRIAGSRTLLAAALMLTAAGIAKAEETQGVTPQAIKIGIIGPFTGPATDFSRTQMTHIAYYKDINAHGGINGRQLELHIEDSGCDEAKGIAAARKLISEDKVFVLDAFTCSGPALAAKSLIAASGIPWVVGGAAAAQIANPPVANIFQPTPNTLTVGAAMADFIMTKPGTKTIAVISHSNDWAKGYYDGVIAELKTKYGIKPVLDLAMERGSTDATPQLLQLRSAKPDAVMVILYPQETSIFLRDAKKYGYNAPFISTYGTSINDQYQRLGNYDMLKNFYTAYLINELPDAPGMQKWAEMIHRAYPNEQITINNYNALTGGLALVKALQECGQDPTWAKFITAMDSIHDWDTGVAAGTISFSQTEHTGQKTLYFDTFVNERPTVFTAWDKQRD